MSDTVLTLLPFIAFLGWIEDGGMPLSLEEKVSAEGFTFSCLKQHLQRMAKKPVRSLGNTSAAVDDEIAQN